MPKINVYLPDDLASAVQASDLPVSAICQRALEQALRRVTSLREAVLTDIDAAKLRERLPAMTDRMITLLTAAADRAEAAGAATVSTGDLLHGILADDGNLARRILSSLDVDPGMLAAPDKVEGPAGDQLRFSRSASLALEITIGEALGLGHNYVGTEHLLIGLAAEPDGAAGILLREKDIDARAARRAVAGAVAGYAHLRGATKPGAPTQLLAVLRAELAPLIERIERLEASTPQA